MLPGPSGRPCHASQCGMAWAKVPGLCVPHSINASHYTYPAHNTPGVQDYKPTYSTPFIHTDIHLLISSPCLFASFFFSHHFSVFLCVFVVSCRLIGGALCAICSIPPPPTLQSPPTLPTHHKGGLNHLCASVFPQ